MSNNKKYFFITIVIVAFLLIVSGLFFLLQTENISYKTYNSRTYGFKIDYPHNFKINENEDNFTQEVVIFINDKDDIKVAIKIESLGDKVITLEEYVNFIKGNFIKPSQAKILASSLSESLIGFTRAYRLVYEKETRQFIEVGGLNGTGAIGFRAYVIIGEANKEHKDKLKVIMDKMVDSFELIS